MRGALRDVKPLPPGKGIIPADAGSTTSLLSEGQVSEDHPRGCGEHALVFAQCGLVHGSSPRMRGAPINRDRFIPASGIIPADAGSTSF